jgi:hypothetical protein
VELNYTSVLNGLFLILAGLLFWRFYRTGGPEMMAMMDSPPGEHSCHH